MKRGAGFFLTRKRAARSVGFPDWIRKRTAGGSCWELYTRAGALLLDPAFETALAALLGNYSPTLEVSPCHLKINLTRAS